MLIRMISRSLAVLLATAFAAAAQPPNIVFILADDLGWSDLGCYGSTFYESPHLDRLAADGLRFTRAYTAGSICSPTRASLQTGRHPVRTGVTDYIPGLNPPGMRLETSPTRTELALEETTIAELLRAAGYQTFYSGKWHLGGPGFGPQDQGYEVVVPDARLGSHGRDPRVGDRLTDSALQFLDQRDATRPFFMFLGYHEPHTPILLHPDHQARFEARAAALPPPQGEIFERERRGKNRLIQNDPGYACEVAVLDEGVRRVREKLEQLHLAENTWVFFFSDNGGLSMKNDIGPTSNLPLRAGKGWLYEGGIRVPLIVWAPGRLKKGVTDVPILSTDFFPTFLELAGLKARPDLHADGRSLVPLLRGGSLPPRPMFWHYPHYHGSTWAPGGAVLEGDWKLIEFFEENRVELYDLSQDIAERRDLAGVHPQKRDALHGQLRDWRREIGAAVPAVRARP